MKWAIFLFLFSFLAVGPAQAETGCTASISCGDGTSASCSLPSGGGVSSLPGCATVDHRYTCLYEAVCSSLSSSKKSCGLRVVELATGAILQPLNNQNFVCCKNGSAISTGAEASCD